MNFCEFARARWGKNWAFGLATESNRPKHARCVSLKEYSIARAAYQAEHTAAALRNEAVKGIGDIAANLFEALKAIDTEGRDANPNGDVTIPSEIWDMAQQALAKARGE